MLNRMKEDKTRQKSEMNNHAPEADSQNFRSKDKGWNVDLLELILNDIGGTFKKYQIINYILFCLPFSLSGSFGLNYVFTALNVEYRCFIPECDAIGTNVNQSWISNVIPFENGKPSKCTRYAGYSNITTHFTDEICPAEHFNQSHIIDCNNKFIYKTNEISILNNFHLECDDTDWKLAFVGTANNLGRFIFMPIMGLFSDRYGRRTILIAGVFGSTIFAYIRSIASSYVTFVLFEFLDAGFGSMTYSASFILAMEWIGVKDRVLLGSIVTATYPFGQIFLGLTARAVRNYQQLLRIIYAPGFLILLYFWIAPESIRWLIVNKKKDRILSTLKRAERVNGLKLSPNTIDRINIELYGEMKMTPHDAVNVPMDEQHDSKLKQFRIIFTQRVFLLRFSLCAFAWLTSAFVSYGISLTSITFAGDRYISFIVIAIAGIPAMLLVYFLMESCGRRWTISMSLLIGGLSIITSKSLPTYFTIISITLFFIGKCFITVAFTGLYVYTSELWPTSIRHSMMGLCSTIGRIGAACAPMAPLLGVYLEILPYLAFGLMSLIASILILKLPETLKQKLPDTISEAKQIGRESDNETS
ncbi:solute carrier family 22 member 3-like [Contarinia nasturtii]|uniref:solute carrier family 22 member 3-like n=1 Tax=Contarinia nasturtii TaxID=265458 RepID=UPI0012D438E2|nr:solute carrier family 22 member 3-like [Contarinia nasturtii]XP_031638867.1 solute carrier family 22 member 3-like [Contarinia nasturtii]